MIAAILAVLLSTVNSTNSVASYACDGVSVTPGGQGNVNFPFLDQTYLVVKDNATVLTRGTDFTLSVVSSATTATLTLTAPGKCAAGHTLKITRQTTPTQPTSFRSQLQFQPPTHETAYDRITMIAQEILAGAGVAPLGSATVLADSPIIGDGSAGSHLRWDFTVENTWTGKQTYTPTGAGKSAIVANGSAAGGAGAVVINGVNSSPALTVNAGSNTEAARFIGSAIGGSADVDATVLVTGGGDATHSGSPAILAQLSASAVTPAGAAIIGLAESAPPCTSALSQVAAVVGCGGLASLLNADGVAGVSQGTGRGVVGIGGTNKAGGDFTGGGTGPGAKGTGGGTSGKGGDFTGGPPNGFGVHGLGVGLGAGGIFETASSGALGAVGVEGASTGTGAGVYGHSAGTGWGGYFIGGTSSAAGLTALGGTPNGNGGEGYATGSGYGLLGVASSTAGSYGVKGVATSSATWAGFFSGLVNIDSSGNAATNVDALTTLAKGTGNGITAVAGSGGQGGNFTGGGAALGVLGQGGSTGGGGKFTSGASGGIGLTAATANTHSAPFKITTQASAGDTPVEGEFYTNSTSHTFFYRDNGAWQTPVWQSVGTAKGDIVTYTASATPVRKAIGADGTVLVADSAQSDGSKWYSTPLLMATTAAGATINNTTFTDVVYGTVETDTDSAYNSGTGVFTVPTGKGGHYAVSCSVAYNAALTATDVEVDILVAGTIKRTSLTANPVAAQTIQISAMVFPTAGQTIKCQTYQNSGAGKTLQASGPSNFITIKQIQ